MSVHDLQQPHLDLRLVEERFLVLDDLDGYRLLVEHVVCFHHLPHKSAML